MTSELDTNQYDVTATATVSTTIETADTSEAAREVFWDGADGYEQFSTDTIHGMQIDVVMDRESTAASESKGEYAVEVEATVHTELAAPNAASAIEQFQQQMGNSRYFEIELIGGIVVTVDTAINDAEATPTDAG